MNMISTNDFVDLHTQHGVRFSVPMVFVEYQIRGHPKEHICIDKWWVPARKKSHIHKFDIYPDCRICFSQDGFLVLRCDKSREIVIVNPINDENVRIVVPETSYWFTQVYGVFFNPTLKEYCALFGITLSKPEEDLQPTLIDYTMLNLGCKPCWREIRTPLNCKTMFHDAHPILIREYLYWKVNPEQGYYCDIIEYNIRTEVFTLMHYPCLKTVEFYYYTLDLLNIDGFLSLIETCESGNLVDVNIWTLKDRTKQLWTRSEYHFKREAHRVIGVPGMPIALAAGDGELLIQCSRKLFVCNLKYETIRQFGKNNCTKGALFYPHVIGLASLRNCKSKIHMEGEDDSTKISGL